MCILLPASNRIDNKFRRYIHNTYTLLPISIDLINHNKLFNAHTNVVCQKLLVLRMYSILQCIK